MNNSSSVVTIAGIIFYIVTGKIAWSWANPHSFIGGVGFLIAWAIVALIAAHILAIIVSIFFSGK